MAVETSGDAAAEETSAEASAPHPQLRLRALLALGVALVGVGAFLVGIREAVRRIPPNAEAAAAARGDSARRERAAGRAGGGRGAPAPAQPEDLPRLR